MRQIVGTALRARGQASELAQVMALGVTLIALAVEATSIRAAEVRTNTGAGPAPAPIALGLEAPHLGFTYLYRGPANGSRFFAGRVLVTNSTNEPITISPQQIVLSVDGTEFKLRENLDGLQHQTFQSGRETVQISTLKVMSDLRIPPHSTRNKWVVFGRIPAGGQVPDMALRVTVGKKLVTLDVNEAARSLLGLTVERIGPRRALALLTINGQLNTVNVGSLAGVLESMVTQKVVRAVIRFGKSAHPLDGQCLSWLQQGAYLVGRTENVNAQMPVFPAALRELHLARLPNRSSRLDGATGSEPRIHRTDAAAVRGALKTAFAVLPREELLAEIEHGHPLSRIAALAEGGSRLAPEDLKLVLHYADDADPQMQLAALSALRHFGDRPAIEMLLKYARKSSEPTASLAIDSLAASRSLEAHQALLNLLRNEHPPSRRLIVRVLAKYPRPIWSDAIYSFLQDPEPEVAVEALRALKEIGHPRLFPILKEALERGSGPLQNEAFQLLAARTDRASEELALEYTLEKMKAAPPTSAMYTLLNRTKDARAVKLLLTQLDRRGVSHSQIIGTLAQLGDQSVADVLVRKYDSFSERDKTATLNALQALKSPQFRKLAAEALTHNDTSLVNAAVVGLQNDGSPQAVDLLVRTLESSRNPTVWSYITNALANFGTAEARYALRKAGDSTNERKRNLAIGALRSLRQRSPGFGYCLQARQSAQAEKWDEAIARYGSAIELDPDLSDAFSGRGHAYLQKKKLPEAHKDFLKAVDLDPFSSEAVTGLGICLVQEGKADEGIKIVEASRSKMNNDYLYTYNAACVYGRALERTLKQPNSPERQKRVEMLQSKAISDLRQSVRLGFPDFDWMKKDPDLDSLHGVSDFKKILSRENSGDENPEEKEGVGKNVPAAKVQRKAAFRGNLTREEATRADFLFRNARP